MILFKYNLAGIKFRKELIGMMKNGFFSIHEFAERSHVTRDTLLHYDRLGLLVPAVRAENNYRYYSSNQLAIMKIIRVLQQLGMSLEEIKELKDKRTPELFIKMGTEQISQIDKKIDDLMRARKLLLTYMKTIQSVKAIDEDAIIIKFLPAEPIILGELNDFSRGRKDYDAELSFYRDIKNKYPDIDLNYPIWATFSQESLKRGEYNKPERFYFYNPEGYDRKPAGMYAIGYTRAKYGQNDELFKRLFDYIEKNGFEICGNAYEEYPLDEACIVEDTNYLIRILIEVREK